MHLAPIAVAPILPSDATVASFGLAIDRVRIIVVRPAAPPDTLADTTVSLPPDSATLDLDIRVPLIAATETLEVSIIALSGTVPLFQGTAPVEVTSGGAPATPTEIPVLTYVGPGAGVDSLAVSPALPFIYFNDSLRFQVEAFQAGVPVSQFYVSWSTSDTNVARVNGTGLLRAPATRTSLRVIARTPGGAAGDSTTATFVPFPTQLVVISGGGQTAGVGQPLETQLEVEVRAPDNLPVGGVDVRFRSLSGGTPADTIVTADAAGRARVTGVLGAIPGTQTFQASLPDFPGITAASFVATATGTVIAPATSVVTVASGNVISGNTVKLRLQGKDASGSDITSGGANVVFTRSGGSSTGSISATADSGNGVYTAVFTGVLAGTATTIGATIDGAPVTSALPTIAVAPGAISTSGSVVTVSNGTVASGAAVTLRLRGRDAAGNNVATGGATVVFSNAGGTSTGTIGATADSGNGVYTAAFTGELAGTGTSIGATLNGSAVTTPTPSLVVIPGAPAQLVFIATPSVALTGAVMTSVQVEARDLAGNATTGYAGDVTIAIGTNPGSGSLAGTLTQAASGGVATFSDLAIDLPGIGYTLAATASGVSSATSASFDVLPPSGTILWANALGGNWSNPANWSGGVVPGPTETAAITLPGTYTVTLDVGDTVGGLQLGASSGTQTLLAASKTLHVSGTSQIGPNGLLWLKASTLAGGTLANGGTVFTEGATAIATGITTTAGSLIRLQGNGSYSTATLTVASGFTNNGSIVLTDSTSSYGATLNVTSGTLTNGPSGTINAAVGTAGPRTLGAQLDNQGTLTMSRLLTLSHASAAHVNSGVIDLAGGNLAINQSGTLPSFTNTGSITMAGGDSVKISSGAFNHNGGSISGGTLSLSSVTVTAAQSFSTATAGLSLASSAWGGSGTVTIAPATTVVWRASTITSAIVNQGTLVANGSSAFNGPVSNAAGATLELEGNGSYSTANLSVANSFTNNGAIILTDITSSYGATLSMPSAILTNAPGATIEAAVGTAGPRTLAVQLNNQGTLTLNRPLTLARASAAHLNSGTIDLVNGNLSISQSGTSPSFTNAGTITIAGGDSVKVSSGALNLNGGSISGGTLSLSSTNVTSVQAFNTATAALSLASSTWGGSGTLTVAPGTTVFWRASTITAPLVNQATILVNGLSAFNGAVTNASGATLELQGNGSYSTANLTVANSFTNNGAIVLTDITSSYGATLTMPASATLTNAPGATIESAVGTGGPRTLALALDNQGTVTLNRPLSLSRSPAPASHLNSGTIDVIGGSLTIGGTTPTFTNTGTINIASGDSLKVSSGSFNYTSGSISGGGTFALTSATVTAAQSFSTATAALSLASSTWGGTGTLTIAAATSLLVRASTINTALVNQGTLIVNGTSAFNGVLTNASGATLRLQGNGSYSTANLAIANGFTNNGTIELTDSTSSYGAILGVTSGTLVNAPSGTIAALTGTLGPRTLSAQLDNQGSITVAVDPNQALTISKSGAAHQNSGTIAVSGGDLAVTQFGTSPSFTNTGAITVALGDTFRVSNGAFTHNGGTISGAGALSLNGVTAGAFNVAHSIASMLLTTSTVSFATAQSTGATGFTFSGSIINGPGSLTNDPARTLIVRSTVLNTAVDNQGTLIVNGSSQFNGPFTTGGSSLVRIQGNGNSSTGTMTVASGFTNNGAIELTDSVSSYGAILNANGTLTNAPGATIAVLAGANGGRSIGATLDNQGTLTVATAATTALTLFRADADHVNSGVIDISSGDLTVNQTSVGSLTNTGSITIGAGDTLTVSNGSFSHNGGALGGAGTLVLSNDSATFNVAHTVATMKVTGASVTFATPQNTGATGFSFDGTMIKGPGLLTNDVGKTLSMRYTADSAPLHNLGTLLVTGATTFADTFTTGAGSLLRIQGNSNASTATLNVPKGFVNNGAIELTDVTSAYGATLTVAAGGAGTLVNAPGASIDVLAGANGPRTLNAPFDNLGTLNVALNPAQTLIMTPPVGATVANGGTVTVSSGDVRINQSGVGAVLNTGAISIAGPDTLTINGGEFNYNGGTLDGPGTLVLTSVNPANFTKPHTLGSIILSGTNASFASDQSTATTNFALASGSTLNGPGTFTNAPGKTLNLRSSSIAAPLLNQGTLVAQGTSSIDGALTTAAGSTLLLQGNSLASTSTLTVNNGLLNNGTIELTDITSAYGANLIVKTLPLVNAAGGTIDIQAGANGPRTIDVIGLDNQGTITGNQPVTISHTDAVHTNRGTIKVKAGAMTFAQSGGNPSLTNQTAGIIDIDAGAVFRVTNGTVTNVLGGKILGSGTLDVRPPAVFSNDGEIIPGASPGKLTIAGNMQIPTSGIITIELGGPTPGTEYDQLAITGAAIFAEGTLNVSTIGAFDPKGLSFDVMTFGPGSTTGPLRAWAVPPGCNQPLNTGTSIRIVCP